MNPNGAARRDDLLERDLCYRIVNAFFEVYNWLGFGFLESVYARALDIALRSRGLRVEREVPVQVFFHEHLVGNHRIDMLVEGRVVVEIKSSEQLSKTTLRQTRNYLAAANLELGLVLHFGPEPKFCRILARKRSAPRPHDSAHAPDSDA
ncbi:MAG TPA: GxxExxY protein [Gemmatimonadaceae bacterium]|nr:GxxExxY protein [Gemmatimonadaceae bacterium]